MMDVKEMNKEKIIIATVVLILDQFIKILISSFLIVGQSVIVIPNFFNLTYVLNTGAALSILQDHQVFLILISFVLMVLLLIFQNNFKNSKRNNIAFGLLFGGIIGNLVDRIFHNYVIDFLDFHFGSYSFPVFNMADIAIVFGVFLLIIAVVKGEDNENKGRRK